MTKILRPPSCPIDHLARRGAPDAPALLIGDRVASFADLDAGVGRLASWLLAQAGGPGERVARWSAKTRPACLMRSEERRGGKEGVSKVIYRWLPETSNKKNQLYT